MNLKTIISQGKLKTYGVNSSFLQVYWSHPSLKENSFYLFVFTVLKNDLVSVNVVSSQFIPKLPRDLAQLSRGLGSPYKLVKDKQEEIDTIIWTVSGKVKEIRRSLSSEKKNVIFD